MENDLVLIGRNTLRKEAEALSAYVNFLDENFSKACEMIYGCQGTVLLTGMGKSGLVARKWFSTFLSTGTKSYFINPAEASHGDLGIVRPGDVLIALSYSGETAELGYVLRHAKEFKIPVIAVTGNVLSSLSKQADLTLSVYLSEEACPLGLAPTTSTTLMMALGDAVASVLMQMRGFTEKDFGRLHPGGSLGRRLWLRVSELMHKEDELPMVGPEDALERVLVEMTQKRLGAAVVVKEKKVLGIITDGDLRRYFQKQKFGTEIKAADLMTKNPKNIAANALAVEAREMMEQNRIHHLLVQEEQGKLLGILHQDDLLKNKVV